MRAPQFDYIIVGAGSAGSALACRLTESGRHRVLLLEAGGEDRSVWLHIPLGVGKLLTNDRYAWRFETEPQAAMQGQRIYWPRGKVLGGSSAINGMAYVWGDPKEFDRWRDDGCVGWGYADVRPFFQLLESNPYSTQPGRGHSGPVRITDRGAREPDPLSDAFISACRETGIAQTTDYNVGSYEGVRYLEQTAFEGRRWSTASAYLRPARRRKNLAVETRAQAARILFENTRAVGVEYRKDDRMHVATAGSEVLLCAGAIQSPQLLELSGVGSAQRLGPLGIRSVAEVPAVGENMIDHLHVRCSYQTMLPITINDVMRSPWHRMRAGLRYVLTRKGLMAGTSSTAHAITRTRPGLSAPDVMVRLYQISGADRHSRSIEKGLDSYSGFSIGGFMLHPRSRGSLHIASSDPREHPKIQPNYLSCTEDCDAASGLLRLARAIASQPSLRPFVVAERRPGPDVNDENALQEYIRQSGQTAWHTVGTCRMGSGSNSVVDARLRVRGVHALRVIDASVMPSIPSTNTNAPAIMIGEKGAALVLEDAKR